ncbi:hypothetical protein CYLTODRAFT_423053 [Cylindrobasidium torrendii FP15055 ss-10]|uniref:F-box domain-containing protein n=1 Tax=Cylindrobasidium torrendii FP15055 ss-10 TaxID=1314674 RepID=A0A0D7B8G9_9AGAR|nr:hypothetical protein CYLTODRAFT_423053 [Cylindrobasidium torrendii FP15055 ss-10]
MAGIAEWDFTSPYEAFLLDPSSLDESTMADIRQFVAKQEARLSELDNTIAHMSFRNDDHLERVMSHRSAVNKFVVRHKAILSINVFSNRIPIERPKSLLGIKSEVPVEIWCYIFKLCLPQPWGVNLSASSPLDEYSPWAIAGVCMPWRDIALGMPELWSTFKMGTKRYDPERIDRPPIALTVKRAAGKPLSLTVDNNINYFPDRAAGLIPWEQVHTLRVHQSRAISRSVRFDTYQLLSLCKNLHTVDLCHDVFHEDGYRSKIAVILPCVRRLSVTCTDTMLANLRAPVLRELAITVDDFNEARRRSVTNFLSHSGSGVQRFVVHAPREMVTHLDIFDTTTPTQKLRSFIREICPLLPNLRELDMNMMGSTPLQDLSWLALEASALPHLTTLRFFLGDNLDKVRRSSGFTDRLRTLAGTRALKEVVLGFANVKPRMAHRLVHNPFGQGVEALRGAGIKVNLILDSGAWYPDYW